MTRQQDGVRVGGGFVGQRSVPGESFTESRSDGEHALEELRSSGWVGPATVELLVRLGWQFVRSHSFPPPEGYSTWNDEAVEVLLAEMFSRPGSGHKFVLTCYVKAPEGPAFERLLLAAIRNFLIDQAKRTERGKLRVLVQNVAAGSDRALRRLARIR
ncbi:hypothetical protein [Micromonospora sicca]|uniref:hypothetical protein n=1 Tax=Micromonospora sicca TaxID=2202420 RepID=UPI0011B60A7B|nr:hypothetical protein [Micromonospora sp. 4G51]